MKKEIVRVSVLVAALMACAAARAELVAQPVLTESFGQTGQGAARLTTIGWTAHYGATAEPFFPVPGGYANESQPYIVNGYLLDNNPGSGGRDAVCSGTAPKLVWTEKIGAAQVDVSRLSTLTFFLSRDVSVRPAVKAGGTWYLMGRSLAPGGTTPLVVVCANETWDALAFEPSVEMTIGAPVVWPVSGLVEAIGFYYQNAEPTAAADDLLLDEVMVDALADVSDLFASDSFLTTSSGNGGVVYTSERDIGNATNATVVVGNAGFSTGSGWLNGNDRLQPFRDVSLSHPGAVFGTRPGSVRLTVSQFASLSYRNSQRKLAADLPTADTYYMSGLIRITALDLKDGEAAGIGFDNSGTVGNTALTNGFHIGVRRENGVTYLSAFAGTQAITLAELDEPLLGRTWQVVLKLTADALGKDALTAWYARDDNDELTLAFEDAPVETYAGPASLQWLRLTTRALGRNGTPNDKATAIHVDEVRLGTSLDAVTTLPQMLPGALLGRVAQSVLLEQFRQTEGSDNNFPLTDYGWQAHYGAAASSFYPVPQGYASDAQPYVRRQAYILDNMPGDAGRTSTRSGTEPKLIWTDGVGAAGVDVSRLAAVMFTLSRQTAVRPAVQVDGGTAWYVMNRAVAPVGTSTHMIDPAAETWNALTFDPGTAMAVGGPTALPASGAVTAFGFYSLASHRIKIFPYPMRKHWVF